MRSTQLFSSLTFIAFLLVTACSPGDSCENTICMNGGTCVDGVCDCPEQFTGPNCQDQVTPYKIMLRSVTVTRFPAYNDDAQWDAADGPDIYFRLYDEQGPLTQPLMLIENAAPNSMHVFNMNSIDLFNVEDLYTIKLLDYEGVGEGSQEMGSIQFPLYEDENGFPKMITIDDGGPLAFTLEVEYFYTSAFND